MASSTFFRSLARRFVPARSQPQSKLLCSTVRPFSNTALRTYPRKDSQDRNSINTGATEYSKSGTDDQSAAQEGAAFDPKVTSPEKEKDIAGKGNGPSDNPLEVSPANKDVSQQRDGTDGGAENSGKE